MKNLNLFTVLLVLIILGAIGAGYFAGYYVYNEYKEKTSRLEEESRMKFGELEKSLKGLYVTLENTMDSTKIERKEALSMLNEIRASMKEWERSYRNELAEIRGRFDDLKMDRFTRTVENLQRQLSDFRVKMQDMELKIDESRGVDLGRISVTK